MKLVKNASSAWRWFSMQALALQGAIAGAWLALPDDLRDSIPPDWLATIALILAVLGAIGRLVDQGFSDERK